ncbi:MAG TPA: hypothetical protein VNY05_22585 [Candidatus Acidoferrales bacterium]|jgi:hypothetical protein|nr:hypothetical protein [Candidatus Acidoferrales bacterium]
MGKTSMSEVVGTRLQVAAEKLGTANPLQFVGGLLQRTFTYPVGSPEYAANALTPGAAPCEPSFSEHQPNLLRFTIVPLSPDSSPCARRNEATREMRRLVDPLFGHSALRWFDQRSEEFRGTGMESRLDYGAFFGNAYDAEGLSTSKVYYEMHPHQVESLPPHLREMVKTAMEALPGLRPLFTKISCGRDHGSQRVTLHHRGPLRLSQLSPLMEKIGLAHQLPSIMQVIGLALGGRFDLPERSAFVGLQETSEGPEMKLEIGLGMIPDLPPGFLDLLTLGLAERPRELHALGRWLRAFTPDKCDWPGRFSVLSIRTTPLTPARVSLYLRPVEFEINQRLSDVARLRQDARAD